MVAIAMLFPIERLMEFEVLALSPLLGVISAMVFIIKASMLSGVFYIQAAALLIAALLMAIHTDYATSHLWRCVGGLFPSSQDSNTLGAEWLRPQSDQRKFWSAIESEQMRSAQTHD